MYARLPVWGSRCSSINHPSSTLEGSSRPRKHKSAQFKSCFPAQRRRDAGISRTSPAGGRSHSCRCEPRRAAVLRAEGDEAISVRALGDCFAALARTYQAVPFNDFALALAAQPRPLAGFLCASASPREMILAAADGRTWALNVCAVRIRAKQSQLAEEFQAASFKWQVYSGKPALQTAHVLHLSTIPATQPTSRPPGPIVRNKANWPTQTGMDAGRRNDLRGRCSGPLRQTNPICRRRAGKTIAKASGLDDATHPGASAPNKAKLAPDRTGIGADRQGRGSPSWGQTCETKPMALP